MKIRTSYCDEAPRGWAWSALDEDTCGIGYGDTEAEAIADLKRLLVEKAEFEEEKRYRAWRRIDEDQRS